MNEQLKPCPFCGGKINMTPFMGMITFKCSKCEAIFSFVREEQKAVAIEEWNRRAKK